jgi:hypothetical protein
MNVTIIFPHDPVTFSNLFGNMFDVVRKHVVIHEDELKRIVTSFRPGTTAAWIQDVLQKHPDIFVRNPQGFIQIDHSTTSWNLSECKKKIVPTSM